MDNSTSHEQELLAIIAKLQAKNLELEKRLVELETKLAKLGKNSSTSSNLLGTSNSRYQIFDNPV